jgi:hypothetical protein
MVTHYLFKFSKFNVWVNSVQGLREKSLI